MCSGDIDAGEGGSQPATDDASGVDAIKAVVESLQRDRITFVVARLKGPMEQRFD